MIRWLYRRMAWKNDPSLFFYMHPWLVKPVSKLRNDWSWPFRDWLDSFLRAAENMSKEAAIRDVYDYQDPKSEVKYWKYDGRNGDDVYQDARERGWIE
jgi:hypothetical protein